MIKGSMVKKNLFWHLLLAAYAAFVFMNSLTPASISSQESGFVLRIAHQLLAAVGIPAGWLTEHIIRKCAHFTEYTVMGLLLCQSSRRMPGGRAARVWAHLALWVSIPFVDETLQLFTEGRSGQMSDVWLDMSGVFAGTVLTGLSMILFRAGTSRGRKSGQKL